MNKCQEENLRKAMSEAARFILAGKAALKRQETERGRPPEEDRCWATAECAAARRASMDCSRALARFRGNGRRKRKGAPGNPVDGT